MEVHLLARKAVPRGDFIYTKVYANQQENGRTFRALCDWPYTAAHT